MNALISLFLAWKRRIAWTVGSLLVVWAVAWLAVPGLVKSQVESAIVHLQFQDRVSQILSAVRGDMERLVALIASDEFGMNGRIPAPIDVERWIRELEATYTTLEQQTLNAGEAETPQEITFF